jgi:hypothetical protein
MDILALGGRSPQSAQEQVGKNPCIRFPPVLATSFAAFLHRIHTLQILEDFYKPDGLSKIILFCQVPLSHLVCLE